MNEKHKTALYNWVARVMDTKHRFISARGFLSDMLETNENKLEQEVMFKLQGMNIDDALVNVRTCIHGQFL